MRYNLKSVKIVLFCTTNTTTNANEIKALTRVESEKITTCKCHPLFDCIASSVYTSTILYHIQYCTYCRQHRWLSEQGKRMNDPNSENLVTL